MRNGKYSLEQKQAKVDFDLNFFDPNYRVE
jgi:hypothetical protein